MSAVLLTAVVVTASIVMGFIVVLVFITSSFLKMNMGGGVVTDIVLGIGNTSSTIMGVTFHKGIFLRGSRIEINVAYNITTCQNASEHAVSRPEPLCAKIEPRTAEEAV